MANMPGYDVIGDIHGCGDALVALLGVMGYRAVDGVYRHPDRQAVFVGDLVDRGDQQLLVLQIVKAMVDAGSARIVMGNHEFNAIGYALEHDGEFLRPHSDKNTRQHRAFLDQVVDRREYLDWFATLPLWLDLGDIRVVHACWHEPSMRVIENALGGNRFGSTEQLVSAFSRGTALYEAVEVVLKGPEISLTDYGAPAYVDKDGHMRTRARVAWWNDAATTVGEIAVLDGNFTTSNGAPYPPLPEIVLDADVLGYRYQDSVPVFYGHYWRRSPAVRGQDWTVRSACVDFSAVRSGELVAYRWSGEAELRAENYVGFIL